MYSRCDTRGTLLREKQKAEYNADPNFCQFCGKKIPMGLDKLFAVRKKRFCDRACMQAAKKSKK